MTNQETDKLRLGILGPVFPYRGGIAIHLTMLHRELARHAEVLTLSFSRQYPRWLYPGRSDLDPGREHYREPGVLYALDSLNPLTWLRGARLLAQHRPDLVLLPWWTAFWAPCFGLIAWRLRRRGIPVMFLCFNVVDHEEARWKEIAARWVLHWGKRFLVQSQPDAERLKLLVPGASVTVHANPAYVHYPPASHTLPHRDGLELLFFGFVRPYKGIDVLIEAMHLLRGEPIHLAVVGEWWRRDPEKEARLAELVRSGTVEVVDRYVPEAEAAAYFERADALVAPYRHATGSAVIFLAYHFGKPVIASAVGAIPGAVREGQTGLLVPPEDPVALAQAIRRFASLPPGGFAAQARRMAEEMSWSGQAQAILAVARQEAGAA
ncbi:MAG: glycosyltransferase [SAR324 cluster bacterium]